MNDALPQSDLNQVTECAISVDAMGGDLGPKVVVDGLKKFITKKPQARVILHGPEDILRPLLNKKKITEQVTLNDVSGVVSMSDKPSQVMRNGKDTSMWAAIDSVRNKQASVCVSCGNTGALMAVSMVRLRKAPGVNRPAIACLWPSKNPAGFNVMLDVGADIRADHDDLLTYALMGVSYANQSLGLENPRVGLLNVGVEKHKGRAELKLAHDMIGAAAPRSGFEYVGFVEGGDIPSDKVDVIVTDGFTGNIALKTGEGTASLISSILRESLLQTISGKIAALMARGALMRMRKRIDPRRVNGGVFLGLNGTVVKSHGSTDATGFAAALILAHDLAQTGFSEQLVGRVASALEKAQSDAAE